MDYEKAYNDALEKARFLRQQAAAGGNPLMVNRYEQIFPELAESEDEKIRKAIDKIMCLSEAWDIAEEFGLTAGEIRSYIAKQKEQKPAEWSEEDERMLRTIISDGSRGVELDSKQISWLKSLRPQPHWKPSEEQMEALNAILCIGDFSYVGQATKLQELYIELKKL